MYASRISSSRLCSQVLTISVTFAAPVPLRVPRRSHSLLRIGPSLRSGGPMTPTRRSLLTVFALAAAAPVVACGSSDDDSGGGATTTPTKVKVGVIPIVDVAPIYLGIKQGFFSAEKLELTLETAQGGAAIVPS